MRRVAHLFFSLAVLFMTAGLNGHTSLVAGIVAAGSLELDRIPPLYFLPCSCFGLCFGGVVYGPLRVVAAAVITSLLLMPPREREKLWPTCITSRGGNSCLKGNRTLVCAKAVGRFVLVFCPSPPPQLLLLLRVFMSRQLFLTFLCLILFL